MNLIDDDEAYEFVGYEVVVKLVVVVHNRLG